MEHKEQIKNIFTECGLPVMGVAAFTPELFRRAGDPEAIYSRLTPKSFLIAILPYYSHKYEKQNIAKYATVPDYMKVFGAKLGAVTEKLCELFPENVFMPLCNVDPLAEVYIAQAAGLGAQGRHNLLINPEYGSYIFLGHIATDLELPPDKPLPESVCTDCGLCVKACPTGALNTKGAFDRQSCVSHINQKNGALEKWQEELVVKTGRLWGCDICQDACPYNKNPKKTFVPEFLDESRHAPYLDGAAVGGMSHEEFTEKYRDRVFLSKNADNIWRNLKLF